MTTYGKIENGQFIPAHYGEPDDLIAQGYSAFDEADVANYFAGLGELSDGTNTAIQLINARKANLQAQIDELDKKRIRAIAEPTIKDTTTEQTWLEFYNAQIQDLRAQLVALA